MANVEISAIIQALQPFLTEAARKDSRLPAERILAEQLNISRRRLRLALDDLQNQGVVFRRHGQGTFVAPPPHPDRARHRLLAGRLTLAQLMEVRRQIEPRLTALAAIHARPDDLESLEALMQRSRNAISGAEYDLADEVFHYRIAELSENALYLEIYNLIRQLRRDEAWLHRRAEVNSPHIMRILGQQHQQIFDAIAAGDVEGASHAQLAHLDFVTTAI